MFSIENFAFKRGNTALNDAFVGAAGTISVDIEGETIRFHDGKTPGGKFTLSKGNSYDSTIGGFISASWKTIYDGEVIYPEGIDLSDRDKVAIFVNGQLTTNYNIVDAETGVSFAVPDRPVEIGDTVNICNILSLADMVLDALGQGAVDQAVIDRINGLLGEPDGIAPLDSNGKVPAEHLPAVGVDQSEVNSIIDNRLGEAGGLAPLDGSGKVPAVFLPEGGVDAEDINNVINAQKGEDGGIAPLDNTGLIPNAHLPELGLTASEVDQAINVKVGKNNGLAPLDSTGKVPAGNLPKALTSTDVNGIINGQKGQATGLASLDNSGKVPQNQLPDLTDFISVNDTVDLGEL